MLSTKDQRNQNSCRSRTKWKSSADAARRCSLRQIMPRESAWNVARSGGKKRTAGRGATFLTGARSLSDSRKSNALFARLDTRLQTSVNSAKNAAQNGLTKPRTKKKIVTPVHQTIEERFHSDSKQGSAEIAAAISGLIIPQ